jgi:hypothetical protein
VSSIATVNKDDLLVEFYYRNHEGKQSYRRVLPMVIWYGTTQWHPEPQWFLKARADDRDGQERDFAMSGILGYWSKVTGK